MAQQKPNLELSGYGIAVAVARVPTPNGLGGPVLSIPAPYGQPNRSELTMTLHLWRTAAQQIFTTPNATIGQALSARIDTIGNRHKVPVR